MIFITLDTTTKSSINYLRVDCNEVRFDKANVEALCRIGASTKKEKERTKGYIGEKGIGFKSIFKVADTVHISSMGYEFKFDRRGMLAAQTEGLEKALSKRGHVHPEFAETIVDYC